MKTWKEVPAGIINAASQRLWGALGYNADLVANRLNTDSVFLGDVADNMISGALISQESAREIMGKNFFGIEESTKYFKVDVPKIPPIQFSEKVLYVCRHTHVLVAVPSLSIRNIRNIVPNLFYLKDRYIDEEFAAYSLEVGWEHEGEACWRLVPKEIIMGSDSETWSNQRNLLSRLGETSTARVVVYTIVGHFLATKERLFEESTIRCSETLSDASRVCIGGLSPETNKISITSIPDNERLVRCGVVEIIK